MTKDKFEIGKFKHLYDFSQTQGHDIPGWKGLDFDYSNLSRTKMRQLMNHLMIQYVQYFAKFQATMKHAQGGRPEYRPIIDKYQSYDIESIAEKAWNTRSLDELSNQVDISEMKQVEIDVSSRGMMRMLPTQLFSSEQKPFNKIAILPDLEGLFEQLDQANSEDEKVDIFSNFYDNDDYAKNSYIAAFWIQKIWNKKCDEFGVMVHDAEGGDFSWVDTQEEYDDLNNDLIQYNREGPYFSTLGYNPFIPHDKDNLLKLKEENEEVINNIVESNSGASSSPYFVDYKRMLDSHGMIERYDQNSYKIKGGRRKFITPSAMHKLEDGYHDFMSSEVQYDGLAELEAGLVTYDKNDERQTKLLAQMLAAQDEYIYDAIEAKELKSFEGLEKVFGQMWDQYLEELEAYRKPGQNLPHMTESERRAELRRRIAEEQKQTDARREESSREDWDDYQKREAVDWDDED